MSRGLWFVAGAGAGVYAMIRGRRAAEVLTVDGLRDRAHGLAAGARAFREEVAQGAAEAEVDLRARMGLVPHGRPELAAPPSQTTTENPGIETTVETAAAELERGTT
ncbi:DUF6167 family protein [Nocardioides pantholopis]|uniref:DUF6167 family protein n=1 Tax=Nocardioides pantholopis TaxID=2483798 RepID=UPI0019D05698|nr:DUF6167 family protein [Nocardioides pantholopis]